MFAAAVYACKRLLVQKTNQTVLCRHFFHDFHGQLVMIVCNIGRRKDRREFMLRGGDFVVLRFGENAELPEFFVQFFHKRFDSGLDRTEIVIFQFLSARRFCAEQGTAAQAEIFSCVVHFFIHEEIFLFGPDRRVYAFDVGIAK